MSAGSTRPNFFLLLSLNPDERWEEARFVTLIEQKRREWSRESTGIGPKANNAKIYLSLLPKIQQVMSNQAERDNEAIEARKELADQKKARLEKFEQQFLRAQSKGFLEDGELTTYVKDFADVLTEAQIRQRATVPIRAATTGPSRPDLLEASIAKEIAQKLDVLHLQTLYELLGRPPTHSRADLKRLAEQLYTDMVKRPPAPETTLKMELAGQGIKIFDSDAMRAKYDATLHWARIDALLKDLEEIVGKTASKKVDQSQVKTFLEDANRCGWRQEEALAELEARAQARKWILIAPALPTTQQQRCGFCNVVNTLPRKFCQKCNRELNLDCPNCGQPVVADAVGCGNCGFRVGDRFWVESELTHCQQLIVKKNISEAQDLLDQLEVIWKPKTRDTYRQKIEAYRAEIKKILKEQKNKIDTQKQHQQQIKEKLEELLRERKFYEARQFLNTQPGTWPDRRLYQPRIDTALSDVQKVLAQARSATNFDERITNCEQALLICVDCQEARDLIKTVYPPAPKNLQAIEKDTIVMLSWEAAPSKHTLSYRIVRKKRSRPLSATDGDILQTVKGLVYDDSVPSHAIGVPLYYAVYTEYAGALSTQPASLTHPAFLLQEVTNLSARIDHNKVGLSWTPPQNVQTVVVMRKEGQKPQAVDDPMADRVGEYGKNQKQLTDPDVEDEQTYYYTLYCQFRNQSGSLKTTSGASIRVKPEGPPEPPGELKLTPDEKDSQKVHIEWSQPKKGTLAIIRSPKPLPYAFNEVVPETNLDQYGTRLESLSTSLVESWTQLGILYYTPVIIFHNNAYVGEAQRYAFVENVRDLRCEMANSVLRLYWTWPEQCERVIVYSSDQGKPLTEEDPTPASFPVNRSSYEHIGYYDLPATPNRPYFLLVAAVMKIDNEQITAQGTRLETRLSQTIHVTYEIHKPTLFRKQHTLHIASDSAILPAFWLVSKRDRLPFRKDDGEIVLRIAQPGTRKVVIGIPGRYPPNTFVKLFLEDDEISDIIKIQQPALEKLRLS